MKLVCCNLIFQLRKTGPIPIITLSLNIGTFYKINIFGQIILNYEFYRSSFGGVEGGGADKITCHIFLVYLFFSSEKVKESHNCLLRTFIYFRKMFVVCQNSKYGFCRYG